MFGGIFWAVSTASAAPTVERLPASDDAPLSLLSSQADDLIVAHNGDFTNRLIIAAVGSSLKIIDTETWKLFADQPTSFDGTIGGVALMPDGNTLVVTLAGGNLATVEIDNIEEENEEVADAEDSSTDSSTDSTDASSEEDETTTVTPTDPREIDLAKDTLEGTLGAIVADPDSNASSVYFLNTDDKLLLAYDLSSGKLTKTTLENTPTTLVFASSDSGDRVVVGSADGKIMVGTPGSTAVTSFTIPTVAGTDTANPNVKDLAVTPDGNFVYVLDSTNDAVWVFSLASSSFVSQVSSSSVLPIRFDSDENATLTDLALLDVLNPEAVYGFISGADGLSIINATDPGTAGSSRPVVDTDTATSTVLDPITLSGVPGPVAFGTDGYVYTSNGNGEVSVISDNPFVSIDDQTVSLSSTASTFTLTFQSDEVGTYRVVLNSDVTATDGTELVAETELTAADTDVITETIDINNFDRSLFEEGTNRIFIFVEDADGNVGRDALDITVDRPPTAVTVESTGFGNEKVYAKVDKLSDEDISTYQMFVLPAESQGAPSCPGSLDFTSDTALTGTLTPDECNGDTCTLNVSGLDNGTYYCVAVRAVDAAGQEGDLGFGSGSVSPEETVGPAGISGETGCALTGRGRGDAQMPVYFAGVWFLTLLLFKKRALFLGLMLMAMIPAMPALAQVEEQAIQMEMPTPTRSDFPEHKWFSLELKGIMWFPTNSTVKDFVGSCCNLGAEAEFGLLYRDRYNFTMAVGWQNESGNAVGVASGGTSTDTFDLLMIPIRNSFIYRFDFQPNQILVPYLGAGADYVYFRETTAGNSTQGFKFGAHGQAGMAILLNKVEDVGDSLRGAGIDDVYLTLEGRYSYINSFKSTGLDLSGVQAYVGVMLAF